MRIATLQFKPKLGDVQGNIRRADEILKRGVRMSDYDYSLDYDHDHRVVSLEDANLDLLVLSELALTGYNFPSLEAIKPYTEPSGCGPSAAWARQTAQRLGCMVCVGYPEIEILPSPDPESTNEEVKYYNSLLVVDEQGEVLVNYRKMFLYYTDETWASEGSAERGFHRLLFPKLSIAGSSNDGNGVNLDVDVDIEPGVKTESLSLSKDKKTEPEPGVATSFGICMDINPYRFLAPSTAWEFANRVLSSKSQLVILSMAWTTFSSREELDALNGTPDLDTFNYWIQRLMPLIKQKMEHISNADGDGDGNGEKNIIIVISNRSGEEDGTPLARYTGTSSIIAVSQRARSQSQSQVQPGTDMHSESSSSDDEGSHRQGQGQGQEAPDLDVKILCWDMLGATSEGVCFADTRSDPRMAFQLVRAARS
ncbi:carbon-nitrogen hydrolase [Aspergillus californicus]